MEQSMPIEASEEERILKLGNLAKETDRIRIFVSDDSGWNVYGYRGCCNARFCPLKEEYRDLPTNEAKWAISELVKILGAESEETRDSAMDFLIRKYPSQFTNFEISEQLEDTYNNNSNKQTRELAAKALGYSNTRLWFHELFR